MLKKLRVFSSTLIFIGLVVFIINFISGYFGNRTATYVKHKAQLVASSIIENAIRNEVVPYIDVNNLIMITELDGEVKSLCINTEQVNTIISNVNKSMQTNIISKIDSEELKSLTLPFGIIISDTLFSSYGPDIKIEIYPVGSYNTDIITTIQEFGINNSLLRLDIFVSISFNTIIPLNKQEILVETSIPILVQTITGKVPYYYYSNTDSQFIPTPINPTLK